MCLNWITSYFSAKTCMLTPWKVITHVSPYSPSHMPKCAIPETDMVSKLSHLVRFVMTRWCHALVETHSFYKECTENVGSSLVTEEHTVFLEDMQWLQDLVWTPIWQFWKENFSTCTATEIISSDAGTNLILSLVIEIFIPSTDYNWKSIKGKMRWWSLPYFWKYESRLILPPIFMYWASKSK